MSDLVVTLRLSGNADGAVTAVRLVKRETDGLGDSTERAARRGVNAFDGMTGSLKGFAKQAAASALAAVGIGSIGMVLGAAVGQASDFGQAMAEVSTVAGDMSQMDAMTQSVRELAKEYGQAPTAQAKALYEIISGGVTDSARAMEVLDTANRLAIGGVTDVKLAADGLVNVLNGYGEAAGTATEVSDKLFVAAAAGKTTIGELSASIGNVAPIAAITGVSLDELLAATAALTLGGVKTSVAMDGVRAIISQIIKPSQEASVLAGQLGLQFNAAALKSQGLAGFLKNVEEATGGSAEQMAILFGGAEAIVPAMSLTGNQADAFARSLEASANAAGTAGVAYEKMAAQAEMQFNRLKAAVGDSMLSIGESMLTVLAPAAAHLRLAEVFIEHLPWLDCIQRYDRAHTLHYCDPPYWDTEGYGVSFGLEQYEALAEVMRTAKGKVMLSINDHPEMRRVFKGFRFDQIPITYTMGNGTAGKGAKRMELVVMSW